MPGILVFAEHKDGKFRKPALEAVSTGKKLAGQLNEEEIIVIIGSDIDSLSQQLSSCGPNKIAIIDNQNLKEYSSEGYTFCMAEAVKKYQPSLILFGGTLLGKDLAPRLAASINAGIISDAIAIELLNGKLVFTRPMYAGKVIGKMTLKNSPGIITLRPNVFSIVSVNGGTVPQTEKLNIDLSNVKIRTKLVSLAATKEAKIELTEAEKIISAGRAIKGSENFKIIEDLAETLKAAIGASRAVVDAGWKTHDFQVGQTGKTVSPTLYIACGISGAIQHLAGMSSSKYIIAINKDPDAPIFKIADFGIVGDIFEVLPLLTEEIKKLK